jgi:predicted metal-binding protein
MRCGGHPNSAAVPATVSDEPSVDCHWAKNAREGGAKATTREPGDLPSQEVFLEAWRVSRAWRSVLEFERSIPDQGAVEPAVRHPDGTDITILVCRTCRDETGSDAFPRAGQLLAEATRALAAPDDLAVAEVECLGNCKRRLSAALLKTGAWSYVFGDLSTDSAADLVAGAKLFATSEDGLLPWRGRPESLKRGLVARIPPLSPIGNPA